MLHEQTERYDQEELEIVVDKITTHLNISIAELERRCNIPEKVLVMALNGSRTIPNKHQLSLQKFILDSGCEEVFAKKFIGDLTEEELHSKKFWYDEVRRVVREHKNKVEKED